jgi:hypothetical protein
MSQFNYLEKISGRQLDLFHDYHPAGSLPLNSDEIQLAQRANTYDYVNWKPAANWADADGSDASVNASIKQAADNIKAIAPHKIFLTVWHEPENDVSAFDNSAEQTACTSTSSFKGLKGSVGTPAQYRAMWQNVRNIFNAEGVTNVVWVISYQGYAPFDCLKTALYPGNDLVDWITFEAYPDNSETISSKIANEYNQLTTESDATHDFTSKPWGIGEFGTCSVTSDTAAAQVYTQLKGLIDSNAYPRLKMYMVYDDTGNNAGPGCLVDRSAATLTTFKSLANDPILTRTTPPVTALGATLVSPANGATLTGTTPVVGQVSGSATFLSARIDNTYQTGVHNPTGVTTVDVNTSHLSSGKHTLYLRVWDASGNHVDTSPITIDKK